MYLTRRTKSSRWCEVIVLVLLLVLSTQSTQADENPTLLSISVIGMGRPVILIPGLMSDSGVWSGLVDKLSADYQLHLVSVKGFGSISTDSNFDFGKLQKELADYTNELDKPIVVGHSFGGFLAMAQAINYPDSVSGVVSIDGLPFIGPVFTQDNSTTVADLTAQAHQLRQYYASMSTDQFEYAIKQGLPLQASSAIIRKAIFDMSRQSNPNVVGEALYALMSTDLRPSMSEIKAKLLLLGASGGIESQTGKESVWQIYQQQMSGAVSAKTLMNEHSRHFIMFDDRPWLLAQLTTFIEGIYQ